VNRILLLSRLDENQQQSDTFRFNQVIFIKLGRCCQSIGENHFSPKKIRGNNDCI